MGTKFKNKLAAVKELVQSAYANGATLRQIAEVHGVSAGTVRNCLVEQGVDLRPRGRRKKDKADGKQLLLNTEERVVEFANELITPPQV